MFQSLAIFDNEKKDLMLELRWPIKRNNANYNYVKW